MVSHWKAIKQYSQVYSDLKSEKIETTEDALEGAVFFLFFFMQRVVLGVCTGS